MEACRTAALAAPGEHTGILRIERANESIPLRHSTQHAQAREGVRMVRFRPQITPYPSPFVSSVT
eukprot:4635186-Pyramimonas_sp.AAC.1